jgi:hypothetical protein
MANELVDPDNQQLQLQCMGIGRGNRKTVSVNCVKMNNQTVLLHGER